MNDGMISVDSDAANQIGFTSDKFAGYLWKDGDRIIISAILSHQPRQGNFSKLIATIESLGLRVAVPNASPQMQSILANKGFQPYIENDPMVGKLEIWERSHYE